MLASDLRHLPWLHEECGHRLGGSNTAGDRVSGGPLPGMPFNASAAEVRTNIIGILAAWVAMIRQERRVPPPLRRDVPELVDFLLRQLDWLGGHPAAGDISKELMQLVSAAWRVIDADPVRTFPLGPCLTNACQGQLTAVLHPDGSRRPTAVRCSSEGDHRWLGSELLQLGHALASRPSADRGTAAEDTRWLSAADIAALWDVRSGSVYRLASEQRWGRRRVGGRTYYLVDDAQKALGMRRHRPSGT